MTKTQAIREARRAIRWSGGDTYTVIDDRRIIYCTIPAGVNRRVFVRDERVLYALHSLGVDYLDAVTHIDHMRQGRLQDIVYGYKGGWNG